MEDINRCINKITKTNACTKAYHEPRYDMNSEVTTEDVNEVRYKKGKSLYFHDKSNNSSNFRKHYNNSPHTRYQDCLHTQQQLYKMKCYYCDGKHSIDTYKKFKKDKDKYNLGRGDISKKYTKRLLMNTKKSNISINEAAQSSRPQESTYLIEQAKQVIGGMQLSDTGSDSN